MRYYEQAALNRRLLEEAREGWDHIISDEVVYVAQLEGTEMPSASDGWVHDYVERTIWFECLWASGDNPIVVALVEFLPENATIPSIDVQDQEALRHDDDSVLVKPSEFIEDAQEFEFRALRSVVWLKAFDSLMCGGEDQARDRSGLLPQRKRDGSLLSGSQDSSSVSALPLSERPCDVIKGRAQVGDDVANHQCPRCRVARRYVEYIDNLSGSHAIPFSVFIGDSNVWLRAIGDVGQQHIEMFMRPTDFRLGAAQWVFRHDEPPYPARRGVG